MPRASISLTFCNDCGHIFNREFEADRLRYAPGYENSLHCSGQFQGYASSMARGLVERYGLKNQNIVEIGCGRGEFLALLCDQGGNRGIGFDPSYDGPAIVACGSGEMTIRSEYFDRRAGAVPVDFVCCRHTLEHIGDPRLFLEKTRDAIGRSDVPVVFEVPNALYSLAEGMWDIIYEHCSYYSAGSLSRLFAEKGFTVVEATEGFEGQFAIVHARTGCESAVATAHPDRRLRKLVDCFASAYKRKVEFWDRRFASYSRSGKRVVVWGAGAKNTTFLNTLKPTVVEYVVDINPLKQGKHVAGTGQLIVKPESLADIQPDIVIIQNRNYFGEISGKLWALGISPEMVMV